MRLGLPSLVQGSPKIKSHLDIDFEIRKPRTDPLSSCSWDTLINRYHERRGVFIRAFNINFYIMRLMKCICLEIPSWQAIVRRAIVSKPAFIIFRESEN